MARQVNPGSTGACTFSQNDPTDCERRQAEYRVPRPPRCASPRSGCPPAGCWQQGLREDKGKGCPR
eukprot:6377769-Pyramimonas_sp.AAC.1